MADKPPSSAIVHSAGTNAKRNTGCGATEQNVNTGVTRRNTPETGCSWINWFRVLKACQTSPRFPLIAVLSMSADKYMLPPEQLKSAERLERMPCAVYQQHEE